MLHRILLTVLLFLVCLVAPVQADERILDWDSGIHVQPDSTLLVVETLRLRVEHDRIKHGPYRDFPTRYTAPDGHQVVAGFRVVDVERDGLDEPYHISRSDYSRGVRVYIGDPDHYVPEGVHTYELTYEVDRELIYGDDTGRDYDELYWNVTGNEWAFPIDRVTATVFLPDGAGQQFPLIKGYTGPEGSRDGVFKYQVEGDGLVRFKTTHRLDSAEGFTFELGFPKGIVKKPSPMQELYWLLRDNIGILLALLSLFAQFGYFLTAWYYVGRDPDQGTIIPLYEPPAHLSPAQVRYLMNMASDHKTFSTAVVDMAVKGALTIEQQSGWLSGKEFTLHRQEPMPATLSPEEITIYHGLLGIFPFKLSKDKGEEVQSCLRLFSDDLEKAIQNKYFVTNTLWLIPGGLIVAATFFLMPWLPSFHFWVVLGAEALFVWAFFYLMKAPTTQGRKVMDRIEGFKMFLSVAEKDRMNFTHPPEITPEVFEKYLPYALALDVENEWAEQFHRALVSAGQSPADYHSPWYRGNGIYSFQDLSSSIGDSISSAVSSSLPSESSGGGGFSGGGGGGGGGGGW
jgi:uncharacterized membrane protein YgcG